MIDITEALAGIVADFESTLDQLRDEADAARGEAVLGESELAKTVDGFRMPSQTYMSEADFDEDDVYRWQRWRR
ncbi:hypothetical protein [Mycobacteroides abscessus]|uniref:Uncharacterized protein n=1 Tax=Mycobacteroides abscessus TaxID=36809 RepID=A0A0U0ZJ72_9MYCO|nr:hypothetical protein [Mycobacteroides abscessus]MBL3733187.1 hypothetical protein [Mycobacteroides abscessus subsp. massiliense]MBL3747783.1 hypothetical protein [Mycobacteroides abscessus subsp. massiliense]MBL3761510.1 hypothetical protein [Mycobacteroides abscessus subsp. massiliense]MBN7478992.1 hypothetical protein [Mycobacteroides abscessus subsp. massiliense]MDB2213290.1 hypothetical protein [Mycobacteroides abscessus subsp. massiliense]